MGEEGARSNRTSRHLAIFREIGDRSGEGADLTNLGECYVASGEPRKAIEFLQQSIVISREIGKRKGEALALSYLAGAHSDEGEWSRAIDYARQALRVADEIGSAQASSEGRGFLAGAYLGAGAFVEARATAEQARDYDYAPMSDNVALVLGIALLREGRIEEARVAFRDAVDAADRLLAHTPGGYDELHSRALALCGLALIDDPRWANEASETFRAARAITAVDGIVTRVLHLFDAIAAADETGILTPIRLVAAGET